MEEDDDFELFHKRQSHLSLSILSISARSVDEGSITLYHYYYRNRAKDQITVETNGRK